MTPDASWDPDGPASSEGLFGLPHEPEEAAVRVIAVPFEATVSSGTGAASAPQAILEASQQVDLDDGPWRDGVAMLPGWEPVLSWNEQARDAVRRARAGEPTHAAVDAFGLQVHEHVASQTRAILGAGAIPAVLGGDHSTPVGAVHAAAELHPGLGLLHIDAHADLRDAYEGFRFSHASAIRNMLDADLGAVASVGLRDVGQQERAAMRAEPRVVWWMDEDLARSGWGGEPWPATCRRIVASLPPVLWITWDVDGLDPALCPGTGTPVPGGLRWREAMELIAAVRASGRQLIGFDIVEVGTSPWDANVGARLLWALAGCAVNTRR